MSLWLTHPLFLPSLIVGVTIVLWATSLLPEFITALLFFAAAMMAKIAPPEVIFGGFASSAFWLVFSGFVLGIAIRKTGLADRAAQALSARLTDSWPRMVASVVLLSYALAFVMPSNMGRIALLMPIVAAMARRAGIADGSRGWFGLALAVGFGTFQLSATILPANVPNLVMSGAAEGSYGIHLNYVPYLLLHTPVLGWLKGAVLVTLICWLFPGKPHRPRDLAPLPPMSRDEKRLAWLLAVVLSLWVTESWHGVGPAWTGLAAAVITLLPRVGFINGEEFASGVNMRTCIYVAGILGLAWGYALHQNHGDQAKAQEFVKALYKNVEVLDSGARGSTNTFVERGIGDVLIAWENEALLATNELGKDKFEIVTPSESILAEPTVSVVDKVVDKKGTRQVAEAYLKYLYSPEGQEIAAKNFYRPRDPNVAKKYANEFPKLKLFTIDQEFGGWTKAQKEHFSNGGTFDQISQR
ncbi:di- and tricarboxylate transporter [Klebsiella pneumoniae]|nr:di- and tricarboxylate transporter [Klebsiella pneumoniae]